MSLFLILFSKVKASLSKIINLPDHQAIELISILLSALNHIAIALVITDLLD